MANWIDNYMQVMARMTPEEKLSLLDSVKNYDSTVKNKILKAHLDAKAQQFGISMPPAAAPRKTMSPATQPIDNWVPTISNMPADKTQIVMPKYAAKVWSLFKKPMVWWSLIWAWAIAPLTK